MDKKLKTIKNITFTFVLALTIVLLPKVETAAAQIATKTDYYNGNNTTYTINGYTSDWKVISIKSSNKAVASVKICNKANKKAKCYAVCTAKKPGSTIITYKYKQFGKTYTNKFKWVIKKYNSPISNVTIGTQDYTTDFKKKSQIPFINNGGEQKISVKVKKGYTVDAIYLYYRAKRSDTRTYLNETMWDGVRVENGSVANMNYVDAVEILIKDKKGKLCPHLYMYTE